MVGRLYLCYGFEEKQPWHVLRQSTASEASQESMAAEATNTSPSTPVQTSSTWRSTCKFLHQATGSTDAGFRHPAEDGSRMASRQSPFGDNEL